MIQSNRPELDVSRKTKPERSPADTPSKYEPVEMSDASVYDLARAGNTMEYIGRFFGVPTETVSANHTKAYNLGKHDHRAKPQRALQALIDVLQERVLTDLSEEHDIVDDPLTGQKFLKRPKYNVALIGSLMQAVAQYRKDYTQIPLEDTGTPLANLSDAQLASMLELFGYTKKELK